MRGWIAVGLLAATLNAPGIGEPTGAVLAQESLTQQLEPLQQFVGRTWRAQVAESDAGEPVYDVSRWERALNGQGIRIVHSVNDGDYGGETMVIWDPGVESLVFYYFTTAGFYTRGTITVIDGRMVSREEVTGNEDGISVVESTSELVAPDRMRVITRFLKHDEWTDPTTVTYEDTPEARVVFR